MYNFLFETWSSCLNKFIQNVVLVGIITTQEGLKCFTPHLTSSILPESSQ